jgi:hypothetical protein
MNTSCKFFYLKEVNFALKGETPVYACDKGHDIGSECNKSCPDLKRTKKAVKMAS